MVFDIRYESDDIVVNEDSGDLATIDGDANVEQSVALLVASDIQSLVGEPINGPTVSTVESRVTDALRRDPEVTGVQGTSVLEVDKVANVVTLEVQTRSQNYTFTLDA